MQQEVQVKEKNKMRLTALDICALVNELRAKCLGMRVSNVYNIDQKTYVFKFSRTDQKEFLIVENGLRFNLTNHEGFQKSKMPSGFTMKFRKFLRSRRLEAIEQVGVERVVVMSFGVDQHRTHIILELYGQGNLILADKDYRIIQLTRHHEFSETARVAPNEIYPFEYTATNYIEKINTSVENIKSIIEKQNEKKQENNLEVVVANDKGGKKKGGKQKEQPSVQMKMKEIVFKIVPCLHTALTDDLIKQNGFNPNEKVSLDNIEQIKKICDYCLDYLVKFKARTQYKGFLVAQASYLQKQEIKEQVEEVQKNTETGAVEVKKNKIQYFDFAPELTLLHQGKYIEELSNFNEAVDRYFLEVEKTEEAPNFEEIAWKKFDAIKQDQEGRIQKLQVEQDEYIIKAKLIEDNISDVEAILDILKKMINGGIQWDKIAKMINDSKKEGDPLANLINDMDFMHKKITVLLGDENSTEELTPVILDLNLTGYQNQRKYFEHKKKFGEKEQKTKEAAKQALKQAELTAQKEIEREQFKQMKVSNKRKQFWFEKFYWFISTDGLLVISGRDVQQNELLVKKYLGKNDLYMHADMYGSTSTIIKGRVDKPVPDNTLMQAATATLCRSKAWESKIVVGTWWVYANQVSKSAPAGLFVGAGSFMIYGKKNFIYPPKLEMGYSLLYALDQESIANHAEERKQKFENQSEMMTLRQDETEVDPSETTEKNVFDSDEEEQDLPQQQPQEIEQSTSKFMSLTQAQIKSLGQTGLDMTEVTIVEVNPNARKVQEKLQKFQKDKAPQQETNTKDAKDAKVTKDTKDTKDTKGQQNQQKLKPLNKKELADQKVKEEQKAKEGDNRQVRGRQGKLKKMKEKYAEQSDEEKEIRMSLMGGKQTKEMVKENLKKKQNDEPKNEENKKEEYWGQGWQKKDEKSITEILLQKQNLDTHQNIVQVQKVEVVEEKIVLEENKEITTVDQAADQEVLEKFSSQDEEDKEEMKREEEEANVDHDIEYQEMQKLVSYLYNDDKYSSLIPMCSPYNVVSCNKFKIKIIPGSLKKGRAAKDICNFFLSLKDLSAYDRKLIKSLTDEEIVSNLLNGVKLTGQGMLQLKQKQNMAKKAAQKKQPQPKKD